MSDVSNRDSQKKPRSDVFVLRVPARQFAAELEHLNAGTRTEYRTLDAAFTWISEVVSKTASKPDPDRNH